LPESRVELQHAGSPSEEAAVEAEDEKRSRRRQVGASGIVHQKPPAEDQASCGLAVVLSGGRRIEVQGDFDVHTFERLVSVLERV